MVNFWCFFKELNCIGLKRATIFWLNIDACTHAVCCTCLDYSNIRIFSTCYNFWQGCAISKSAVLHWFLASKSCDSFTTNRYSWYYRCCNITVFYYKGSVNSLTTQLASHWNTWSCNRQFSFICFRNLPLINFVFLYASIRNSNRNVFVNSTQVCSWSNTLNSWKLICNC